MKNLIPSGMALLLAAPLHAMAAPEDASAEIQSLRQQVETMRAAYEARIQALEKARGQSGAAAAAPGAAAVPAAPAASPAAASSAAANAFNPAISLILSGGYTRTSQDPESYAITGFQLPKEGEVGPGTRGFSLAESELGLSASIDPWLRGVAYIALHPDDAVSVEEAYVQTTALDNGLSLKAGRFLSGIGYLNSKHAHTWDFADNPLAYQAMLGTQYGDDGVQLRWLAPTDQYLEFGAEFGRGRSYPGSDTARNGAGMVAFTAHTGGDIGDSHNWRAGISLLNARASEQALTATNAAGDEVENSFSGDTRVWVLDGVWKWAPHGNGSHHNFKLQGEYLQSTRSGDLAYDVNGSNVTDAYRAQQSGWYLQGVYQFMPRWRVGLRTERLDAGQPDYGVNAAAMGENSHQPGKNTVMLDFSASEFSRVRLQFAQDRSREGLVDEQVLLQYQMSLGAHSAHGY